MIVRLEGATLPISELELPNEPLDTMTLAGAKPSTWAMVGHRPVLHCDSGESHLPMPEHPCWQLDEVVGLKTVGA